MKHILVLSGSRADYGLLVPVVEVLRSDFRVEFFKIWNEENAVLDDYFRPELLLVLGDRMEIMRIVLQAHIQRIPIAHIAGGDVTEGSYDDAMRDCISRMASIHFVTSTSAMARLTHMGCRNIHLVGNPAIDVIKRGEWKAEKPFPDDYIVINCQPETLADDPAKVFRDLLPTLPTDKRRVYVLPNPDRGSDVVAKMIRDVALPIDRVIDSVPHHEYLNLLYHCSELIGNSTSMLYEAPELGIKTRMVGNRQKGRTIPMGDGHASERIAKILRYTL